MIITLIKGLHLKLLVFFTKKRQKNAILQKYYLEKYYNKNLYY